MVVVNSFNAGGSSICSQCHLLAYVVSLTHHKLKLIAHHFPHVERDGGMSLLQQFLQVYRYASMKSVLLIVTSHVLTLTGVLTLAPSVPSV